ncbi:MAG: cell division/cell wall cluster transcriptional repressor MraZ, partial [Patescibacteria group bacterium]|nr:cell division/cell wall cluster transcriptional repressor MraZ [Patescibacteria group bacterium]
MLLGQYFVVLTQKDRLSVPSRFRGELGSKIVLTKWVEGCLLMLSLEKLNELIRNVLGTKELSLSVVRETERFLLGSAFEI